MIIPVILAGGSGTRLWPLSRELYPKQLLKLVDSNTMMQNTVLRLNDVEQIGSPIIICHENHRFMVAEQLREIGISDRTIVLEPMGKNTAPAVTVAALHALNVDEKAVLLILPADHHIENIKKFHESIHKGYLYAKNDYLITFGIVPDAPETGYGYIKKGQNIQLPDQDDMNGVNTNAFIIEQFVEKPDIKTAEAYLKTGQYFWNSGMFMFSAQMVINELKTFSSKIVDACDKAIEHGEKDLDFFRLNALEFDASPSDSIDYAVMEKTKNGAMVPLDAGWNDLGSWETLWQVGEKDSQDNVIYGDVIIKDVKNSYLFAQNRLLSAVGLEDHIIVETADAVFVSPRNRVQDVKSLVKQLKDNQRDEAFVHQRVYRPWGYYESIDFSEHFQVKRITVKPGARISLQKHYNRAEHWIVVQGTAQVVRGEEEFVIKEDQSTYIPLGTAHRIANPGKIPLELIEVRTGSYIGEDDVVRFEDDYGREVDKDQ